jgi:GT2 family glycosyltransferase
VTSAEAVAVVVNWNGREFVLEAVESLLRQDVSSLEVVVVDNASTDGSDACIEERFPSRVRLLRNDRNLGWGAANNAAIRASSAPYVILLNSDARAEPAFARELIAAAAADARVGMVAAKVLDHERPGVIDTVGHRLYADGLNRGRGRLEEDRGQYDAEREALFPSGAAALYRRSMLEEIGLFDESFFLYGDDAELGLRARLAGWRCALAPRAIAYHRYSASAGAYSSLKAFHVERNRVWLLLKLLPWSWIAASPAYTALRLALQAWGGLKGRGAAGKLAAERSLLHLVALTLRAWASAAVGAPRVLAARRRVLRRLDPAQFRALLSANSLGAREIAWKE